MGRMSIQGHADASLQYATSLCIPHGKICLDPGMLIVGNTSVQDGERQHVTCSLTRSLINQCYTSVAVSIYDLLCDHYDMYRIKFGT